MRDTLAVIFVAQALLGLRHCSSPGRSRSPGEIWALVGAGLAGQLLGRRAFAWLQGERYERAVLALLAASAVAALLASVL